MVYVVNKEKFEEEVNKVPDYENKEKQVRMNKFYRKIIKYGGPGCGKTTKLLEILFIILKVGFNMIKL